MSVAKRMMGWALGVPLVVVGLAGCDEHSRDDDDFREVEQQVEEATETQQALEDAVDACREDFETCIGGGDYAGCAADLQACLTELPEVEPPDLPDLPDIPEPEIPDLPDVPGFPDPPEFPELSDSFGGECLESLHECLQGGGDPQTCATEAEACFDAGLSEICDQAHQACVDAGAPADLCDELTAECS